MKIKKEEQKRRVDGKERIINRRGTHRKREIEKIEDTKQQERRKETK